MKLPADMAERSSSRRLILRSAFRPAGYARTISPGLGLEPAVQQAFVDFGWNMHPPVRLRRSGRLGLGRGVGQQQRVRGAGDRCTSAREHERPRMDVQTKASRAENSAAPSPEPDPYAHRRRRRPPARAAARPVPRPGRHLALQRPDQQLALVGEERVARLVVDVQRPPSAISAANSASSRCRAAGRPGRAGARSSSNRASRRYSPISAGGLRASCCTMMMASHDSCTIRLRPSGCSPGDPARRPRGRPTQAEGAPMTAPPRAAGPGSCEPRRGRPVHADGRDRGRPATRSCWATWPTPTPTCCAAP